jgi:hypothetical protein
MDRISPLRPADRHSPSTHTEDTAAFHFHDPSRQFHVNSPGLFHSIWPTRARSAGRCGNKHRGVPGEVKVKGKPLHGVEQSRASRFCET